VLEKLTGELEVHVGLKEDAANLAKAFLDVGFVEDAAAAKLRENSFQLF
jgi:hypothetical protein